MSRGLRHLIVACVLAATLSGCGPDYTDLPLPGSSMRGEKYQVSAVFEQALNLAQGAQVKVNGVPVGRVQKVEAVDFRARVTMDIKSTVEIPSDSSARLRYDTPLGELIVEVSSGRSPVPIPDDGQFVLRRTTTAPTVESALSSASTLINGGRLGELQIIAHELNIALGGREEAIRASLQRVDSFMRQANASRGDIERALRSLGKVSRILGARQATIRNALREVGPAAETLGRDTDEFVALLVEAKRLAHTAGRLAVRVDDPLLDVLRKLGPIADAVLSTRPRLRRGLDDLIALANQLDQTAPGETLPLTAVIHVDEMLANIGDDLGLAQSPGQRARQPAAATGGGALDDVLGVLGIEPVIPGRRP